MREHPCGFEDFVNKHSHDNASWGEKKTKKETWRTSVLRIGGSDVWQALLGGEH